MILGILARLPWKQIGIALAAIALCVLLWRAPWAESRGFHKRDGEVAGLHKQIKDRGDASIAAAEVNRLQVKVIEATQIDHTQDANHDDTIRKVAADDAVASYIRLHHATGSSASGADALRPRANPAGSPSETDPNAGIHDPVVVPASDLVICKDAVLKGQSFDAWWPGAAKIINDAADQAAAQGM